MRYLVLDAETGKIDWQVDLLEVGNRGKEGWLEYKYQTAFVEHDEVNMLLKRSMHKTVEALTWLPFRFPQLKQGTDYWLINKTGSFHAINNVEDEHMQNPEQYSNNRFLTVINNKNKKWGSKNNLTEYAIQNNDVYERNSWRLDHYPVKNYEIADNLIVGWEWDTALYLYTVDESNEKIIRRFGMDEYVEFLSRYYHTTPQILERTTYIYAKEKKILKPSHILLEAAAANQSRSNRIDNNAAQNEAKENALHKRNRIKGINISVLYFVPLSQPDAENVYVYLTLPNQPFFRINKEAVKEGSLYDIFQYLGDCLDHQPMAVMNQGRQIVWLHSYSGIHKNQITGIQFLQSVNAYLFASDLNDDGVTNWQAVPLDSPSFSSYKYFSPIPYDDEHLVYRSENQLWLVRWDGTDAKAVFSFQ